VHLCDEPGFPASAGSLRLYLENGVPTGIRQPSAAMAGAFSS